MTSEVLAKHLSWSHLVTVTVRDLFRKGVYSFKAPTFYFFYRLKGPSDAGSVVLYNMLEHSVSFECCHSACLFGSSALNYARESSLNSLKGFEFGRRCIFNSHYYIGWWLFKCFHRFLVLYRSFEHFTSVLATLLWLRCRIRWNKGCFVGCTHVK